MENYLWDVKASISDAVSNCVEGASRTGVLFSGGLDSSLIALLAKKQSKNGQITLYTVGTADSHDLLNAEQATKLLGMNWKKIEVHAEEIILAIPKLAEIIDTHHPVKLTFELPLYLSLANIEDELILSGQGADELFGGYARYLNMEEEELRKAIEKDVKELLGNDIKMDYRIAVYFDKVLKTPFLDENVLKAAMQVPIEYKVDKNQRKIILKEAALQLGLPAEIVNQQKKAVQYSSGILKELRKIAKKKGMGVNELLEHLLRC